MRNMKRILVSLLAILLVVTMLPISATAASGDKQSLPTTENVGDTGWIGIGSADEFLKIGVDAAYPSTGNYYLENDIDFADRTDPENPVMRVFTNYILATFNGTLDGRNNTIKGFTIKGSNSNTAIINKLGNTAKTSAVTNLNIGTVTEPVEVSANLTSGNNVAVLAAEVSNTGNVVLIDNVHIYGKVEVEANTSALLRVAGVAGYVCNATIMNSSFTGSLEADLTDTANQQVRCGMGGICGETGDSTKNKQTVIQNCQVNATMTSSYKYDRESRYATQCTVGGLIGRTNTPSVVVENCTVEGIFTSELTTGGTTIPHGYVGGLMGYVNGDKILVVATDCNTSGVTAMTGTGTGVMYGGKSHTTTRCYVRDCTPNTQNTPTRELGDVDGVTTTNAYDHVWLIKKADDFAKIGKADNGYTYPLDGFYRLAEDNISLGEKSGNVVGVFDGVLDGDGKTVLVTKMNNSFFAALSNAYSAAIFDFMLGAPESYVDMACSTSWNTSVLAAWTGNNNGTFLRNVDVYANVTSTGGYSGWTAGFFAAARNVNFFDCNMYGSVTSLGTLANAGTHNHRKQMHTGGFVGQQDTANTYIVFLGCNNFAEITTAGTGFDTTVSNAHAGGLLGGTLSNAGGTVFCDSNNFGDVAMESITNFATRNAGGLAGNIATTGATLMMECANFGNVYSSQNASGLVATSAGPLNCYDVLQAGVVTADTAAASYKDAAGTATINTLDVKTVTNPVTMNVGAAVRLAEDTGLRFTANVSTDVIERLAKVLNAEQKVTYGTMIAPEAFIEDEFTHEALDAYAEELGFEGDAYIDVPSVDSEGNNVWFKEQVGKLAGSITGLPATLYKTNFSGVAYITIKVGDSVIYTAYAPNAQTRNIYEVAKAALDDTMTEIATVDGYTYDEAIEVGETYYVDGVAKVFAEGDAAVYSCYPKSQRDTLNKIVNDADSIVTE